MNGDAFIELIHRVRRGEPAASEELVRRYEPAIRVAVRARLTDPRLRRVLDSMDICQSVFGVFFTRMVDGRFEVNRPEQLLSLLTTMARNRVISHATRQRAARRDQGRLSPFEVETAVDPQPNPAAVLDALDLLDAVRSRLSDDERRVVDRWARGEKWDEIGRCIGASPDTLRVRFGRALARVRKDLFAAE